MINDLGWKTLEERRAIARLTLLYKSIHHKVAINTDYYQVHSGGHTVTTRKSSTTSFIHPTVRKDCYKYSFLPRTCVEWNLLPTSTREAVSVDAFKTRLNDMQMYSFLRGDHHYIFWSASRACN